MRLLDDVEPEALVEGVRLGCCFRGGDVGNGTPGLAFGNMRKDLLGNLDCCSLGGSCLAKGTSLFVLELAGRGKPPGVEGGCIRLDRTPSDGFAGRPYPPNSRLRDAMLKLHQAGLLYWVGFIVEKRSSHDGL